MLTEHWMYPYKSLFSNRFRHIIASSVYSVSRSWICYRFLTICSSDMYLIFAFVCGCGNHSIPKRQKTVVVLIFYLFNRYISFSVFMWVFFSSKSFNISATFSTVITIFFSIHFQIYHFILLYSPLVRFFPCSDLRFYFFDSIEWHRTQIWWMIDEKSPNENDSKSISPFFSPLFCFFCE